MPFFIRRLIETLIINLVSSVPIYLLCKLNIIYTTKFGSFIAYSVCAAIFFSLNTVVLKGYFLSVLSKKIYFRTNLTLFAVQVVACFICMNFFGVEIYTALFGFTRVFRAFIVMQSSFKAAIMSASLFWAVYFFQILYFPERLSAVVERILDDIDEFGMEGYNAETIEFMKKQKK